MTLSKTIISMFLSLLVCVSNVYSKSSYDDIQLLINQGEYEKALLLTEEKLSVTKSDIKLQFMKGLTLTRLDQYHDAEEVFIQITVANPELPEPFNNLAVVYAAQGKYAEAEEALKNAINTHPSYATAHENLGDIYAKMASHAYNQALELDIRNTAAQEKLSLVKELIFSSTESEKKVIPLVKKINLEEDITLSKKAVEKIIKKWANSWTVQDVDSYLEYYGQEFTPPNRMSRNEWEQDRRRRITRPNYINVTLTDIKIKPYKKGYVEITLTQTYHSDIYSDRVKKQILMQKVSNKWLITQERVR
ncbi:MAG: hypothetical protein CMF45_05885 [Legionellales bacterium]|nr:hypothetical protein [Legionellales bacterium]